MIDNISRTLVEIILIIVHHSKSALVVLVSSMQMAKQNHPAFGLVKEPCCFKNLTKALNLSERCTQLWEKNTQELV